MLLKHFEDAEKPNAKPFSRPARRRTGCKHQLVLPAYDQCIKASHVFNLLDARGVISVTERQGYILRVRNLSRQCGEAFLLTDAGGANCAPEVEQEILEDVGSYGRQLGRIGDALAVLITHFHPERPLDPKEEKAIRALRAMLDQIGDIKERHDRAAVRAGVDADRAG
jgi:hypothetical protein